MMELIQKLRQKSDASKNKIALIFAISVTAVIVGLWILVLKNERTPEEVVAKSKSSELKPLFMIFKSAKDDVKNVKTNIKTYKASSAEAKAAASEANVVE